MSRPVSLSSSYLFLDPFGISMIAGNFSSMRSPTGTSCKGCIVVACVRAPRPATIDLDATGPRRLRPHPRAPGARRARARDDGLDERRRAKMGGRGRALWLRRHRRRADLGTRAPRSIVELAAGRIARDV